MVSVAQLAQNKWFKRMSITTAASAWFAVQQSKSVSASDLMEPKATAIEKTNDARKASQVRSCAPLRNAWRARNEAVDAEIRYNSAKDGVNAALDAGQPFDAGKFEKAEWNYQKAQQERDAKDAILQKYLAERGLTEGEMDAACNGDGKLTVIKGQPVAPNEMVVEKAPEIDLGDWTFGASLGGGYTSTHVGGKIDRDFGAGDMTGSHWDVSAKLMRVLDKERDVKLGVVGTFGQSEVESDEYALFPDIQEFNHLKGTTSLKSQSWTVGPRLEFGPIGVDVQWGQVETDVTNTAHLPSGVSTQTSSLKGEKWVAGADVELIESLEKLTGEKIAENVDVAVRGEYFQVDYDTDKSTFVEDEEGWKVEGRVTIEMDF